MYIGFVENLLIKNAKSKVIKTVTLSHCTYHPPLMNARCHYNALWHLQHTKEVVKVHAGYIVSGAIKPEVVAHFICEDIYGNYFDPTLAVCVTNNAEFHVTKTINAFYVPNNELEKLKKSIKSTIPFFLRPLVKI
ncbi:hypothetical protein VOWphi5012_053 [Vibrio phage phi50-12]|uniref:Uncharacterized protein n=1 Tax=Vibrio phage phi50-12 TaxID=2654972 RepID=A0A5P8PRB8_9CAUD|nr:hypothetical protein KNU82_gp053 [Vibrio phage phi50-12]QFR59837.1 hypothetical protein VOWphi5012_053 [Vibrio phage phi50-12]